MPKRLIVPLLRQRIALTIVAVAATATVRYLLTPWLGNDAPFLLFTLPVLGLAIFAGTLPAVIAIILSSLAGWQFATTGGSMTSNIVQAILFCIVAGGIVWLSALFRRSLARLEAADRHLQSILATAPEAMIIADAAGTIISFSPAAERMFGLTEADAIGQPFMRLVRDPVHRERTHIAAYLDRDAASATGTALVGVRTDGSSFPIELAVGAARAEGRQLYTGFVRDLTQKQAAAARIAGLQAQLDQVGRLGAMGAMASTLAHELNQPISAAAAYVHAVRLQLGDVAAADNAGETLGEAEAEILRAGEIIRNLRSYVARGEVDRRFEPLAPLLREAASLALTGDRADGIAINYDLDAAAGAVLVNRVQLQQALINLIRNAVEAMANSPERLLTLRTRALPDGRAMISVSDTGSGIDQDAADHLFDAFTTTKKGGLGLGLPISRTIIEANGGTIRVAPATGTGTTFEIFLSLAGPGDTAGGQ